MPGLLDIAESFKTVDVNGTAIAVPGISAEGLAYLYAKFPIVKEMIAGKDVDVSPEAIAALAPEVVAAIIATGTGEVNSPAAEKVARKLGAQAQLTLLDAILRETMPAGIGPFVEKLSAMFKGLGVESMSIQDGTSPSSSKA